MRYLIRFWWQISLSILILIGILSLTPLDDLPKVRGSDKLHHMVAYFTATLPIALKKTNNWLWYAYGVVIYSGCIELLQPYQNRYAEWNDWFANGIGVIFAIIIGFTMKR